MRKIVTVFLFVLILFSFNLSAQNIIISEIMQNPAAVGDTQGEWFELFNASGSAVDIDGWTIQDNDFDSHVINNGGPLTIPVGGFLVLTRNSDTGVNGGVPSDYEYSGFSLANGADEIVLLDDLLNEIDRVEYDGGPGFPDPNGASMVFIGFTSDDNNVDTLWQEATVREPLYFGPTTDLGSPGTNGLDQHLPVELTSFVAIGADSKVSLKWVTESEINNQGFDLERANDKDGTYQIIASYVHNDALIGAGNSASTLNYIFTDETVFNGNTYWYKLVDVDFNGVRTSHPVVSAVPNVSSADLDIIDNSDLPKEFALKGNYPNPFNPETTINFDIPETGSELVNVNLAVYNMLGQKIITLIDEPLAANSYKVKWYGKDNKGQFVTTGIYFYLLKTENFISSHKMMLIK